MKEEFLTKLYNNKYISNKLFNKIKLMYSEIIPNNFNLDKYNNIILENNYIKYKNYFENMFRDIDKNIKLDKEQIKAILAEEDSSLILAGAGTGKTTTMAAKVKYLVDIKGVKPEKIVVLSFTKKATEELEKRINIDFSIPAHITTFHSLALKHIREIFKNRKCYVVDDNIRNEIFLKYFKEHLFKNKKKLKELLESFNVTKDDKAFFLSKHFIENYEKFTTYDEYFNYYKMCKYNETEDIKQTVDDIISKKINSEEPVTLKNELVKSKGEAIIANYLYCNGIEYYYEKIYKNTVSENKIYKPDFTLKLGIEEVYLEYFGLSNYEQDKLHRYEKIKELKEEYHKKNKNKFIKLDYQKGENILHNLKRQLVDMGFKLKPKTYKEIYFDILDNNMCAPIFDYKDFLYDIIDTIKSSTKRKNYKKVISDYLCNLNITEKKIAKVQLSFINEFFMYYQNELFGIENYGFDFNDMVYVAKEYIDKIDINTNLNYKYLIIDEYQDISKERYEFIKKVSQRNNSKVIAVGDDWQSIYAFTGSKIKYIYEFEKYFSFPKLFKISTTYRSGQDLINYSGEFVMKNDDQIKKELRSNKNILDPIKFVMFEEFEEYSKLKKLILYINNLKPTHNIMILARNNEYIKRILNDSDFLDEIGTKIRFIGHEDIDIDAMTIHKSKGLTSDEVILIGLNQYFPSNKSDNFWLEHLFKEKPEEESIAFAEERRLFYVALTRAKNYVYLLVNKNPNSRSLFINEIYTDIKDKEQDKFINL